MPDHEFDVATLDGVCDAHMHILGDPAVYPPDDSAFYIPAAKTEAAYADAVGRPLAVQRLVVVQPSVYGADHSCTIDAIAADAKTRRGIASYAGADTREKAEHLHNAGFRGIRLHLVNKPGLDRAGIVQKLRVASEIAGPLGWHLQIFARPDLLTGLLDELAALDVPVVIDHLGMPDPSEGVDQPGFSTLLSHLGRGHLWLKISGADRAMSNRDQTDAMPFIAAAASANREALIWGSDWPHIRRVPAGAEYAPVRVVDMIGAVGRTLGEGMMRQILVTNPQQLYGF